jgi:hypothetical protein
MHGPDCGIFFHVKHSVLTTVSCVDKFNGSGCIPEVSFPRPMASSVVIEDMFAIICHMV